MAGIYYGPSLPVIREPCVHFNQGYCARGQDCMYSHILSIQAPPEEEQPAVDGASQEAVSTPVNPSPLHEIISNSVSNVNNNNNHSTNEYIKLSANQENTERVPEEMKKEDLELLKKWTDLLFKQQEEQKKIISVMMDANVKKEMKIEAKQLFLAYNSKMEESRRMISKLSKKVDLKKEGLDTKENQAGTEEESKDTSEEASKDMVEQQNPSTNSGNQIEKSEGEEREIPTPNEENGSVETLGEN